VKKLALLSVLAALTVLVGCGGGEKAPESCAPQAPAWKWTYTENPSLEGIPANAVVGEADGRPFEVKAVIFEPLFGNWSMELCDTAPEEPLDIAFATEFLKIDLPWEIKAPMTITKPVDDYGMFQIKEHDSDDTTSWNSDVHMVLEITKWETKPYDPEGELFQVAGKASGKIYICFVGSAGFKNSGVAGTFTDAIIRYMGNPAEE